MKRIFVFMAASLLVSRPVLADSFNSIVGQCWVGNDHPKMSACVELRAFQAQDLLKNKEDEIRAAIAKSKEPAYLNTLAAAFEANVKSFQKYRRAQCNFVFILASVGGGPEDLKHACEAELNIARFEQLQAASWWLKE